MGGCRVSPLGIKVRPALPPSVPPSKAKACPIDIPELAMLHNKSSEGLVKTDSVGYDLYSGIADTKALFLKFSRQFERRIRSLVPNHSVVPAGDGEASTTISVPGFVVDAKLKKKTFATQKVELQFLKNHKSGTRRCIWTSIASSPSQSTLSNQRHHCKTSRHCPC